MILKSKYYINGVGIISPQKTFDNRSFLAEISAYNNILNCLAPDFKQYIPPNQIRRLSRMLRIGLSAAMICVQDAANNPYDGVITATGYGLLDDTEKFLGEILEQKEKHLTPTFFMQSTYNALAGLVGLSLKCTGYNNTYVSRGFSFEMALHDAMMQLNENPGRNFLIGAYDEQNQAQHDVNSRLGHYKEQPVRSLDLFKDETPGTIQGEGAAFFSISGNQTGQSWCILKDIQMTFLPDSAGTLLEALHTFLKGNGLEAGDVDAFITGLSGDPANDRLLKAIAKTDFQIIPEIRFKHLCGEFCTASAFGLWLGASILKHQQIPEVVRFNDVLPKHPVKTVLVANQYIGRNYTFMLLKGI